MRAGASHAALPLFLMAWAVLVAGGPARAAGGDVPAPVEVAPGVYMMQGARGEPDPANLGRIGNAGFIVGDSGVIAIDTGTSRRQGVALLEAIGRVTNQPVRLALITHARQEFVFGAAAYRERGIPVQMHRKAALLMAARCENCLKILRRTLGEEEMRGTAVFKPDRDFEEGMVLDVIGRPVRVLYHGHSSGPGDIAVLDEKTGTLFAGGLLDNQRIPDIQDCDLEGWRNALAALRQAGARTAVPGHGPAAPVPEA
ncbi:MAG TPA: MBL fold metallo-hydrolase, partial [Burkholderiales bacterium]